MDKVARAICRERCAVYGEPPCWQLDDFDGCCHDDADCETLAAIAREEIIGEMVPTPPRGCAHEWVDTRNPAVESGEMCLKCKRIRPKQL